MRHLNDVRHSRGGRFAEVMVERIKELGLERGRIGLLEIDPRFHDYLPVNQYNVLRKALPDADLSLHHGLHARAGLQYKRRRASVQSAKRAICEAAMEAMVARAGPA